MKPSENQNREIPEMGERFDMILFKRKVADLLRKGEPREVNYYAEAISASFPKENKLVDLEVDRMIKQRIQLLGIDITPLSGPEVRCFS